MNLKELQVDNWVLLNYGNDKKDICRVENIDYNSGKAILKLSGIENSINIDSIEKWNMIEGIPLKEDHLEQLGFIKDDNYPVYALPDNGAFVKSMEYGNDVIVRKEKGEWVLVTRQDDSLYGCKFNYIPYLHQFQNLVLRHWYIDFDMIDF